MAAIWALASALSFGVSDVAGAMAAKKASSVVVTLGIQLTGFPLLILALLVLPGTATGNAVALGGLAGVFGIVGLVLYLRSMAVGPVGVISPLAALLGVTVPVTWGVLVSGDQLTQLQVAGIVAGAVAIVLVAWSPGASRRAFGTAGPLIALLAGTLFGLFFVVLDATPDNSGLWPLLGSRITGTLILVALLGVTARGAPAGSVWGLILLSGVTDIGANAFFLIATRIGLLSLASLLSSLYPVVALLLARYLLNERLTRLQAVGVLTALAATGALVV